MMCLPRVARRAVPLLLLLLLALRADGQTVDFSKLRTTAKVPPIESQSLVFDAADGSASTAMQVSGSLLFHFEVTDPTTRYEISLESEARTSLVVEVMRLELNDAGQATDRDVLAAQATSSLDSRPATLLPAVFRPGTVYVGVAALREVPATLTVRRVPAGDRLEEAADRVESAPLVANDVAGIWDGDDICVRPERLQRGESTDLTLLHPLSEGAEIRLYDSRGRRPAQRAGAGELVVRNLQQGDLTACIELSGRGDPDVGWRLIAEPTAYPDVAPEPDDAADAPGFPLVPGEPQAGALDSDDFDRFSVPENGAPAYRVTVRGAARLEACVAAPEGNAQECYRGQDMTLGPMAPGSRVFIEHIGARSQSYEVLAEAVPFDSTTMVAEPNYRPGHQALLGSDVRVTGDLSPRGDEDVIGFDAGTQAQMWRVVVLGDGVRQLEVYNDRGGVADVRRRGTARRMTSPDFYLDPGGAFLRVSGEPGPYKLVIKPLGPPRPDAEREPNEGLPRRILPGEQVIGVLAEGDRDRFSFFLDRESRIRIAVDPPAGARYRLNATMAGSASTQALYRAAVEGSDWQQVATLPSGEHILELEPGTPSPAEYRLSVSYINPFLQDGEAQRKIEVGDLPPIQAYSLFRQQITTNLSMGPDQSFEGLSLDSWFAHAGVRATLSEGSSLALALPADLPTGVLRGFLALRDGSGAVVATTPIAIEARPGAAPQGRTVDRPAPTRMIGGINVALSALGARWLDSGANEIDPETGDYRRGNPARAGNLPSAIDGFIVQGRGAFKQEAFLARDGQPPLAPILDLPGEEPLDLVGIGIDTRMLNSRGPRRFAVDLSLDGSSWREVLVADHEIWGRTVYHRFAGGPEAATQVRLRVLESAGPERAPLAISALEVIADPGNSGLAGINIADRRLGALVSGWRNTGGGVAFQIDPTEIRAERLDARGAAQSDFNLAISFRNQMKAEIAALEFVYPESLDDVDYPWAREAVVAVSPRGPAGPWREIARIPLAAEPQPGELIHYALPEWQAAKAVKIDYAGLPEGYFTAPGLIRVLEREDSASYRSVLGLWGEYASERLDENTGAMPAVATGSDRRFEIAADSTTHTGLVEFETQTETWRILPRQGDTVIRIFVQGSPGFEPTVVAYDAQGGEVAALAVTREDQAAGANYEFPVVNGDFLDVKVSEAARSTVFLFDQSPSVAGFIPVIRRAVIDYADSMQAGRDAVQFKALSGDWAREEWFTDPQNLRRALATYGGGDSSKAEAALLEAARILRDRTGSRAIVIITDGDGGSTAELPHALAAAQARVFVIKVSSGGGTFSDAASSQPLVASWAGQTGGEVDPVLKNADVAQGYARATARLLGPKPYTLRAESDYRPLDPGYLAVSRIEDGSGSPSRGRLVIFDASGSMLKRLESGRRITVAKKVVSDFIDDLASAEGTLEMGLRIFGGPPESCDTELLLAPSAHSADALRGNIAGISPRNNARTAIAAALRAAGQDLADAAADYAILLVTDGEETCDGDPLAAVREVRAGGSGPRVDIVGFALDPEIDRRPFERWAAAGDGVFIDAGSSDELASALSTTAGTRFDVLDNGAPVASGVAGGQPIALPPGRYRVSFEGSGESREIQIRSGETLNVSEPTASRRP